MQILAYLMAVAILVLAGLVLYQRHKLNRRLDLAHEARRMLDEAREGRGPRYEIQVLDRGGEAPSPEQRYRGSVWEADRVLRLRAYPEVAPTAPEDPEGASASAVLSDPEGELGVEFPYYIADAPTYEEALLMVDRWVAARDGEGGEVIVRSNVEPRPVEDERSRVPEGRMWTDTVGGEPSPAWGMPAPDAAAPSRAWIDERTGLVSGGLVADPTTERPTQS